MSRMTRPPIKRETIRQPRDVAARPTRLKLLLRRSRRFVRPALFGVTGFGVVLMGILVVHSAQPGGMLGRLRTGLLTATNMPVQDIVVEGRNHTPEPALDTALGVRRGDPILGFSLQQARERIETLSWVKYAAVERRLPGTIVVSLTERTPFAIWQSQGKFVLIGRDGQVVANEDIAAFGELPLVVGAGCTASRRPAARRAGRPAGAEIPRARGRARRRTPLEPAAEERRRHHAAGGRREPGLGQADGPAIQPGAARSPLGRGRHAPAGPPGRAPAKRVPATRHAGEEGMNDMSRRALPPPTQGPADPPALRRALRAGPFGVLDIGTTKVICLIGRTESDGSIRVLGMGWQRGRGVRGGGITDLEEAERAIRGAVAQAEDMSDHRLRSVTVNLTCGQPESRLFNVQWPVGGRAVTDADVRRVVQEGRARAISEGRETIHALPLTFSVDETVGVADPRGHHCETLTARLHMIDAASMALRNLGATAARAELDIAELVSAPMAAGLAVLVEDERELGATVIDMGGGTTGMAVFSEGQLLHTAQLPVGGLHVTNDIARMLSTTVVAAERIKTLNGSAFGSPDDDREMLTVPMVGEEEHNHSRVPRSMVISVIQPRLEETFELVRDRLEGAGLGRAAGTRVVLTGGASQLVGAREMASRILNRQVRLGRPAGLRGMPDAATGPAFAVSAGLLHWAAGEGRALSDLNLEDERPTGLIRRIVNFLRERV